MVLDGAERREVSFALKDYAALDYGYAATVQGAGRHDRSNLMLTTPGMDRHLAYNME
jgi:hypothetical protein